MTDFLPPTVPVRFSRTGNWCVWLLLAGVMLTALPVLAADDRKSKTISVAELLEQKSQWRRFAVLGLKLRVEGRYSLIAGNRLRMQKLDLVVEMPAGRKLPRLPGRSRTVELTGKLVEAKGEFSLQLSGVRELPTEAERLTIRKAGIQPDNPADWYALAEWATRRGTFYEDSELLESAAELQRKGFDVEHRAATGNTEQLQAVLRRAIQLKLGSTTRAEIQHEIIRQQLSDMRQTGKPSPDNLLKLMAANLPGAGTPMPAGDMDLQTRYQRDPLAAYASADESARRQLHRALYADLVFEQLRSQARPDGSNAARIVALLEEQLPDRPALAEPYLTLDLTWRLKGVEQLNREQAVQLAEELRKRERAEEAQTGLVRWIEARRAEYAADGTAGLIRVAELYRTVGGDPAGAARVLFEAARRTPDSREVRRRLEQLGYRKHGHRWVTEQELKALPPDPVQEAIREGRVVPGMSPRDVVQSLGRPDVISRIIGAGGADLVWTYSPAEASPLTVRFSRRRRRASTAEVVHVMRRKRILRNRSTGPQGDGSADHADAAAPDQPAAGPVVPANEGEHNGKVKLPRFRFALPR